MKKSITSIVTITSTLITLALAGCGAAAEQDTTADDETESVGSAHEELRSTVSCQGRTETAYEAGRPFAISVIEVGGHTVTVATGHAFLRMQAAAERAGVQLSLRSGFRTQEEQRHLYECYRTRSCNDGNLAARPGYSRHQTGAAVDVSRSTWLTNNAAAYGFVRTVPGEAWHYEYVGGSDPGGPCSGGAPAPGGGAGGGKPPPKK